MWSNESELYAMSRKATEIDERVLSLLKNQVVETCGFEIRRSVDCDRLAELISDRTNSHISGITFKRLFGFTKYPFSPAIQTLNLLCKFIGHQSWYDFQSEVSNFKPIGKNELEILLQFFEFDTINQIQNHDGGIQSMSRKIALRFREDPKTFLKAVPELVKKKHAQIFFIEHFPDYDNLCKYYYKVFESYLLHKESNEAQLYGNCMLFYFSYWTKNERKCIELIKFIEDIPIDHSIHPFVIGRYYASRLIFHSTHKTTREFEAIFMEYLSFRKKLPKNGAHFLDFPSSEYIIAEALIHCKEYRKSLEIINLAFNEFSLKVEFIKKGYYRQLQLLALICRKKLNPDIHIDHELDKINPKYFYFISEKYFTSFYHYAWYLSTSNSDDLEAAIDLAHEMNNEYLLEFFS